ncbi:globin domain-containing protein [Phenylobacterium terrae]|uniref:Globin domain-containing protein n=1 Tax=Phenylobacterium terrae TaxID=2665495 RepID=A0ABW4MY52_9CAUL
MPGEPAFPSAAEIEASLELAAERCEDLTPLVYARMFERHPEMKPHFWRDTDDAIKGEMLSRTFAALLDFVGQRTYADHMILSEMVTHEGYDVPRQVFATFFGFVRDAVREAAGADWTVEFDRAWVELLAQIDDYIAAASAPLLQPS